MSFQNNYIRLLYATPINSAASQIVFTMVASNSYVDIVGQVEAGLVLKQI